MGAPGERGGRRSWTTPAARERDPSVHLGDLRLAKDLQELGSWEEVGRGSALASGVVGAGANPSTLSRVGEFDNLG